MTEHDHAAHERCYAGCPMWPIETGSAEIDPEETYAFAIEAYLSEATWLTGADAPFKIHARTLARSLDKQMATDGEVQSALASTFSRVLLMLEKRRPGPPPEDPLKGSGPHGEQSIFEVLDHS